MTGAASSAHGVPFAFPSSPDIGPGLSPFGSALVERCAELGVLVDLSHINASRNLTDSQLDAIGSSSGLVGVVFATPFLRPDFDGATIPAELGDGLPRLLRVLEDAGFGEEELKALCWGNWRRVLEAWWH